MRMEIRLSMPLEEAKARLETLPRFGWFPSESKRVVASISGNRVSAFVQRRGIRNSFQTFFRGRLSSEPAGVVLRGRFGMHPFVIVFMSLWFGFLAPIGVLVAFKGDYGALFMAAFGVVLIGVGRWGWRSDARMIESRLRKALGLPAA